MAFSDNAFKDNAFKDNAFKDTALKKSALKNSALKNSAFKNSWKFAVCLLVIASSGSFVWGFGFDYSEDYFEAIQQPIDFSHQTHAGANQISCEYCHYNARESSVSGIPAVRTCMGCHILIAGETEEQQKEIAKVVDYWDKKEPIPWKKIHDLPDFVYFSHQQHLSTGFDCTDCHGDVSQVTQPIPQDARGETALSMGWCMTCHRMEHPAVDGRQISAPVRLVRGGQPVGEPPKANSIIRGPTDCTVCHK